MAPPRLQLPEVTLCAVDTRTPHLALRAIQKSTEHIDFGSTILFTRADAINRAQAPEVRWVGIPEIKSIDAYSQFILRDLHAEIQTPYALVIQWDGYVINPAEWRQEFLNYDYIGAPWPGLSPHLAVGNGGFSLRSLRLLQTTASPEFSASNPEDLSICHHNRSLLEARQLKIAPIELALRFSQERVTDSGPSFGFHGAFHFADLLTPQDLGCLIAELPQPMTKSLEMKELAKRLLQSRDPRHLDIAETLIKQRFSAGLRDGRQIRLLLKLMLRRAAQVFSSK